MRNIILFVGLALFFGCNKTMQTMPDKFHKIYDGGEDVTALIQKLEESKIYFGHQSVGYNIMEGVEQWYREAGIESRIKESRDFQDVSHPVFVHFGIGRNHEPLSKIDDFESILEQIPDGENNIALFKFCYVDIVDTTDVDPLFTYYNEKMIQLKNRFPQVKIVLVTAPYTGIQTGPRALVKRVLRMPLAGEAENIKRQEFNTRLVENLGKRFPVFDLGRIESTLPDGTSFTYKYKGGVYPALVYGYTDDLGHLNKEGAKVVGYNLISFLAGEID